MRMRTPLLAGALCLAYATPAFACNFYFASTFMRMPAKPSFGVGVEAALSDPSFFGVSGDVAMRLGNNMIVQLPSMAERNRSPYDQAQSHVQSCAMRFHSRVIVTLLK